MPSPRALEIRVALVTGELGYGGAERQLTELALRLGVQRVAGHVFCLGGTDEPYGGILRRARVPVDRVPRRGGFDWRRAVDLARRFAGREFDVVHSFLIDTNPYAWAAARLARVPHFVASNRNANFTRGLFRAALDSLVFRSADGIVVNAQAVRRFTGERFRIPAERISVIYNGVDVDRFDRVPARSGGAPTIGTIGSLTAKKNPQMFVDVSIAVAKRLPDVRALHLGEGSWRPARNGGGELPVRYLGSSDRVDAFLSELDVFVLTSDREGCPNVLLEAMASALPIVTTDAGGSGEVIRDGETGYVTPRGDREAMVARVVELLDDPALRTRLGTAARDDARQRFSVERMVSDMVRLYRTLTDRPP
jgi:glycosyltransferase involved in cell wall biosynthesis